MEIDGYAIHPGNSREIKLYRFAIERSSGELSKAGEAQNQQNTMENNENQQKETKRNMGGIIAAGVIIILLAAVWIWMKKKAEKKQYRKQSNKRAGEIYKDQGDYMKKMMICLILIIIGLGINKNIAYGSEAAGQNETGMEIESVTSMYPWVGIDTLEEINRMCQEKKLSANKIKNYLIENSVCLTVKINSQATDRFLIKDSTGINYDCMEENGRVYIYHIIGGRKIALDAEKDKFEVFFEDTKKQSEEVNEKIDYLRINLSNREYGGVYVSGEGQVCVSLINDDRRDELEKLGYQCEDAEYSYEQLYEELRNIWEKKEQLSVNYIEIAESNNAIRVYGLLPEEEFFKLYGEKTNEILYFQGRNLLDNKSNWELENYAQFREDMTAQEYCDLCRKILNWADTDEYPKYWESIEQALNILKQEYPDYSYEQLFYHVGMDGNYQRVTEFDDELTEYVKSLPEYIPNTENPVEESLFGDPRRMELKSQLRIYKNKYPEMSYDDIYSKYLSNWEENRHENRQKKLYNLLYEISEEQEETESESIDSKKSGIKSNMPTAEEKKELRSPVSEYFDTINLEDGITFAENTWRDYLKYYIVRIRRLDNLKVNELGSAEMGKPFLIYNVDGEQPAYVYLPIYKDRKVVHIINELEYANGHWQYGSGPMTFYFFDGDVLDQIGYLKNDCIFYSINNSCYVESKHRKLLMQKVNAEDEDVYSPEEKKFMKMSFSKKQETIDKGLSELKDVDKYCEAGDEDVRKQLTGDSEKNEAQKNSMSIAVAGIIVMVLGAATVKIWMRKEGK